MATGFRLLLAALPCLAACATNPFLHVEPDAAQAQPGRGYVDFFHADADAAPAPCKWQVMQRITTTNLWGQPFTAWARVDGHVYLAEIAAGAHRLVRVESAPGPQEFEVRCGTDHTSVSLKVAEGMLIPVRLRFGSEPRQGGGDQPTVRSQVEAPIPFRRRDELPYLPVR